MKPVSLAQLDKGLSMEKICAWCGKLLDESVPASEHQNWVTHGICPDCAFHLKAQIGIPLPDYLEGLDLPVLLVDGDGRVRSANQPARQLLKKPLPAIEGRLGGDVFECVHARLPEGCGHTIHCSGCTIRRTVTETLNTGQPRQRVPATLDQSLSDDTSGKVSQRIRFLISTQKIGELVLLSVEDVSRA
ncbi:MAG: PAS domain-containing protein [Chloroflexota bacterium]